MVEETVFHKIVAGELPCHKVWEDERHLAFLSIFPNTDGVTVVIPKKWAPSDFSETDDEVVKELIIASKKVSNLLKEKLDGVGRVGLIFEGFGVDYLHAKLFPMHGTAGLDKWEPIESKRTDYFDQYPGYLSSHDANLADDEKLAELAKKIRE